MLPALRRTSSLRRPRIHTACLSTQGARRSTVLESASRAGNHDTSPPTEKLARPQHAVVSTFDLFSIGIGPSSSHTVGPLRAANIFVESLREAGVLSHCTTLKVALYGSLAATGKGHLSPSALMMGFESEDCETVDTDTIGPRYDAIVETKKLRLGGTHEIDFCMRKDFTFYFDRTLEQHPNGMIFSVYSRDGELLANNTYFSVGGGFVVNENTDFQNENVYYKQIKAKEAGSARKDPAHVHATASSPSDLLQLEDSSTSSATQTPIHNRDPPFLFDSGDSLLELTRKHNMTIAQIVYENERHYLSESEIRSKLLNLYSIMDDAIKKGVTSSEDYLPGGLRVKRRAKGLYQRLTRGFYGGVEPRQFLPAAVDDPQIRLGTSQQDASLAAGSLPGIVGRTDHPIRPMTARRTTFPALDLLSCYAIAVNEVNASGGRIVTSPTNGASGVIPSVLKYVIEFISENEEQDIQTFLLTAAAIGMLFKRGATISAAEGGCMAEVGVACSMAAGGFAACLGASPAVIENAAEIGIEHNLGLTCDPQMGLVQVPCIERNALGAVKAITAAQLAIASGDYEARVTLDHAIAAMRQTAFDMKSDYKETSRAGLATAGVRISSAVPEC